MVKKYKKKGGHGGSCVGAGRKAGCGKAKSGAAAPAAATAARKRCKGVTDKKVIKKRDERWQAWAARSKDAQDVHGERPAAAARSSPPKSAEASSADA